jgi:phospholipid-binding lipoprotein MlaA
LKSWLRIALLLFLVATSFGCATTPSDPPLAASTDASPTARTDSAAGAPEIYDPWEPMNRHIYRFNANFDKYVFMPVVTGYRFVLPQFARTGLSNLFSNVGEVTVIVNSILQLAPIKTAKSVARLVVNSTFGIAGLFDVAQHWELPGENEDFGQTLGVYGVGPGPFFVVPILGPSSLRDATGLVVDRAMISVPLMVWVPAAAPYTTGAGFLEAIQARDDLSFSYGELGPFEYNLIRGLYLEFRRLEIER